MPVVTFGDNGVPVYFYLYLYLYGKTGGLTPVTKKGKDPALVDNYQRHIQIHLYLR